MSVGSLHELLRCKIGDFDAKSATSMPDPIRESEQVVETVIIVRKPDFLESKFEFGPFFGK